MNIARWFKRKISGSMSDDKKEETSQIIPVVKVDQITDRPVTEDVNNITPANWIKISEDGEFICSECNNKSAPETNTENGTVTAELSKIKSDLEQFPTKVIYGICPICGMEFTFKHQNGSLFLEPSEMMK
jgi:hypothetical protein